jgi:long-chain acyl-CoA synthetase
MTAATITDAVLRHAAGPATAGRHAVVIDGERRHYDDLGHGIVGIAAALASVDATRWRHRRAGLLMAPGPGFFEVFLGAAAAGMAAMVLQHAWSDRDLAHALAVGAPDVVLVDRANADRVRAHVGRRRSATVDGLWPEGGVVAWTGNRASPRYDALPTADGGAPFYIGFTSGSTGRPKGFVRDHRSWLRSFAASEEVFGITGRDHVLVPGPLDHSLFLYAAVHGLSVGATVHLERRFAPAAVLATLDRDPITRVYLVPTMLAALLRAADRAGRPAFPGVASVICSGARWPVAVQDRMAGLFPNAEPIDFYGASELSFVSVRRPAAGDPPSSVGRPFPGVEVEVRRDDGSVAGTGEAGRLWVRSDMVFTGYLEPDADGARCDDAGWITVGDVARRDGDGHLYLLGREGAMLVCGGVNVFPEEIEEVLLDIPEVAEAAVVGLPHDYWGDLLCAVVRWRDGCTVPRARLRAHCRAHLARGKWPQRWLQLPALPRTRAGKIARATLANGLREDTLGAEELR